MKDADLSALRMYQVSLLYFHLSQHVCSPSSVRHYLLTTTPLCPSPPGSSSLYLCLVITTIHLSEYRVDGLTAQLLNIPCCDAVTDTNCESMLATSAIKTIWLNNQQNHLIYRTSVETWIQLSCFACRWICSFVNKKSAVGTKTSEYGKVLQVLLTC